MPRRRSGRHDRRQEALRRHRAPALIAVAVAALALPATGFTAKPHKPKPKPKITLLTESETGALRHRAIKVLVESKRGDRVRVEAHLLVDGYPEDYSFRLGPKGKRLRNHQAKVSLPLSARQREVLDFAIKSCHGAGVSFEATAAKRTGRLSAQLRMPSDC